MPKKATRYAHVRESAATSTAPSAEKSKRHRSVHIGPRNGRRWLSLKKRLGLLTDDDLIVYLLDLADSITARRDETFQDDPEPWKAQCTHDKKESESSETDSPVRNAYQGELPRRSQRKQLGFEESPNSDKSEIVEGVASSSNNVDTLPQPDSRSHSKTYSKAGKSKRHKSKARHHKEKRKKRKHQKIKDLQALVNLENKIVNNVSWELDSELENIEKPLDFQDNFISQSSHQKDSDSSREGKIQNFHPDGCTQFSLKINKTDISVHQRIVNTTCAKDKDEVDAVEDQDAQSIEVKNDKSNKFLSNSPETSPTSTFHSIKDLRDKKDTEDLPISNSDNFNKKYKRSKYECNTSNMSTELENNYCDESIPLMHKRDKKRHKGMDHQNKKHRDVRKAPQDGLVIANESQDLISCSNELETLTVTTSTVPDNNVLPSEVIIENPGTEPPRLAIKIKLCQECNNRHLQDACPLTEPQYNIRDSITLEQWIQKYNKNSEVMKAYNSSDPMSQGYTKHADDGFESDEETSESSFKSKTKVECEEKQQIVDVNRPLYARDSLPDCLELKLSNMNHGLGVFVKNLVPMYAQLGPLIGKSVQEMDIPDDFSMRHIWEVESQNKTLYISTTNPLTSNWIRYIRPAETKEERNVAVIIKNGELFLVTSKNLNIGTELTYWSDSQSTAWARKNKIDKTNCGGCNLNFTHPIYYRLHCCIFHDTNYSLTIRKYHCKVCGAAVLGKDNIMKHAAQLHAGRGAYQCQYCKKFFLRLNYLEMHRTYGCSQNPQRSRPLCDFCGRKFCQPQKLKVHIKRMHSDMSEVLREFQCKMCLKLLGSRAALQRHMKEVHHKDVVGAATCDRCGKMFQNKSNLKIHMLTHSGVKPFKCKENGCKAAFTTKQCLQFHYKKVHGLSEEMMPKIERSVAYTFDAYSGGLVEDLGRGKTPKFNTSRMQENNDSAASFDDCSSENNNESSVTELPCTSSNKQLDINEDPNQQTNIVASDAISTPVVESTVESAESDVDIYGTSQIQNKSKKWTGEFDVPSNTPPPNSTNDIYDFEESRREEEKIHSTSQSMCDDSKLGLSMYRRTESSNASLLVEAALDAAEREIGAVSSPILEDSDREANLYSISNELDFKTCSQNQAGHRSPEGHLESYMPDELSASPASQNTPLTRHTPPGHMHLDYHIHRPVDYVNTTGRAHNIEQYLEQQEVQRVIHDSSRYPEISHPQQTSHHQHPQSQVTSEVLSSDEGDSVAQNLSLSIKEKSLQQLDLSKYDGLENEFAAVSRERVRFEPLIVQSAGDQCLDMSARGFQQTFGSPVQSSGHHHHHHHHLYEMSERERQGVDLSRTAACISPTPYPPPYPPYPHVDVPRVVSLEPTSRSHHLHTSVSRIITSPQPASSLTSHLVPETFEARLLSPPPPTMPAYNTTYPVGPTSYHSSRSGYHYAGYY